MKIGLLTGGGDCSALNAALRSAAQCLMGAGVNDIIGIEDGFLGLIEQRTRSLAQNELADIIGHGGTILGSCNKSSPLNFRGKNVAPEVTAYCQSLGLDAIIAFGGDGTMSLCHALAQYGLNFVGVPKTIDNDIMHTEQTFGFDSAVSVAVDAIDRLQTTAKSHHRTMIVETMRRYAGWIALYAGVAGNANVILLPELKYDLQKVAAIINARYQQRKHTMIVIAEGAAPAGGGAVVSKTVANSPDPIRLGGAGFALQGALEPLVTCEVRTTLLGHVQRGGAPTASDRILATNYGYRAAQLVLQKKWGQMVCLQNGQYTHAPLSTIANQVRKVDMDHPLFKAAQGCGIHFAYSYPVL